MQTYWWYYRGNPITSARGAYLESATATILHYIETCPGVICGDLLPETVRHIIGFGTVKTFIAGKTQIVRKGL